MRAEILKEVAYIKMSTDIKPNFSALAVELKASRNTIKRYYNMKEGDNPKKKRTYKSVFDPYEDFIRERAQNVAGCTYAALFMLLNDRYPEQKGKAKYGAFTAFCRRKKIIIGKNDGKAHVLFETAPGHQLQVDWKEDLTVHTIDGKELYFNILSATLGASRYHVYIHTIGKTRSDFFRCVRMALLKIGGSVDEILTDNMAAIVKITSETKSGRKKYPDVLQWEKDSGIRIRLCKPRSPETKGKVEVSNKFVDRIMVYDGLLRDEDELKEKIKLIMREANEQKNSGIGLSPLSVFEMREKQCLRPLPDMKLLEAYEKAGETRKVPNTLLVGFNGRNYSVPTDYIGRLVRIVGEDSEVVIYYNEKEIARHKVSDKKTNYLPDHYKQALRQTVGSKVTDDELEELAKKNLEAFEI